MNEDLRKHPKFDGGTMKYMRMLVIFFIALAVPVSAVSAGEKKWTDDGELSLVKTGGNSDVSTFSAKNRVKYKFSEKIEGTWKVAALNSKSAGVRSAENYMSELRGDYLLSERIFAGLAVGWLKDKFSGIDARYYGGPVAGYKALIGPKHFLKAEAGLDYVKEEYTNNTESDFLRGRAFGEYDYHFTKVNKFLQSVEYLYDFDNGDNYNVNATTALVTVLSGNFSFKTSYVVKYDNEPTPAGLDRTDTILGVSVLVSF